MNKWLDRALLTGPYYRLCLNTEEFQEILKEYAPDMRHRLEFVNEGAHATTHFFTNTNLDLGAEMAIVCLGGVEGKTKAQIYGVLVHEAVHIWQHFKESIGESYPGDEQEAYAVQRLSQELIHSYRKQCKKAAKGEKTAVKAEEGGARA